MEETMGHKRHNDIPSADARVLIRSKQGKAVSRPLAVSADEPLDCDKTTNILREARRFRDEWRKHRYSRLKMA